MGVALVLLSAVAYGLITAFILTIINEIAILIHVGAVLEQPFIVKILTTLHLSVDSFSAACVWTVLLYVAFIVLFQLPPVQSLQLKFKNIYEPEGELGDFLYDCWDDVCERAGVNPDKYRLYIQASPEINAFALGHNRVVVLAGLINALTYDELRGVLAHELSHHDGVQLCAPHLQFAYHHLLGVQRHRAFYSHRQPVGVGVLADYCGHYLCDSHHAIRGKLQLRYLGTVWIAH